MIEREKKKLDGNNKLIFRIFKIIVGMIWSARWRRVVYGG